MSDLAQALSALSSGLQSISRKMAANLTDEQKARVRDRINERAEREKSALDDAGDQNSGANS